MKSLIKIAQNMPVNTGTSPERPAVETQQRQNMNNEGGPKSVSDIQKERKEQLGSDGGQLINQPPSQPMSTQRDSPASQSYPQQTPQPAVPQATGYTDAGKNVDEETETSYGPGFEGLREQKFTYFQNLTKNQQQYA